MPRVAVPATLLLAGGGQREGEVYVMERVPQHAGPETPLDMLNRPEAFFPFRPKKGSERVLLVAKARTVTLSVPRPQGEDVVRLSAAKKATMEITLADGSTWSWRAPLALPKHRSRVAFRFSSVREWFFAIATGD